MTGVTIPGEGENMQLDFHYYAAYCAALLSGYSHDEGLSLAYASQFVDVCSASLLKKMQAPVSAATTQLQSELVNHRTDIVGLQNITRIWSSFHFLPRDLYASHKVKWKPYLNKNRLIAGPDGELVKKTVENAKGRGTAAAGLAMHVLADTWAHADFAGTPSYVINNTGDHFYELKGDGDTAEEQKIVFNNNPASADDPEGLRYTNSMHTTDENSIMNLGHGRAGHLPDYSFIRYEYMPAWGDYRVVVKDNPSEYYKAFCQMIMAMRYLRGETDAFETGKYDFKTAEPLQDRIMTILKKRQLDASADWKALGEELSGYEIPDFDPSKYTEEYLSAGANEKDLTEAGQFILAALSQKSMVTGEIFRSGNLLAGFAVDFRKKGFRGIRDYLKLVSVWEGERR